VRDQRKWASVLGGIVGSLLALCVLEWVCWSAATLNEHALGVCALQCYLVDAIAQHMLTCFLPGRPVLRALQRSRVTCPPSRSRDLALSLTRSRMTATVVFAAVVGAGRGRHPADRLS
jgi:hypothetical protein